MAAGDTSAGGSTTRRIGVEVVLLALLYVGYSTVRNLFGSGTYGVTQAVAERNAATIIDAEQRVGLFVELAIQRRFIGVPGLIRFFNIYYGSVHFVVTLVVLILAFFRLRRYRFWRNTIMIMTGLALIGYALFPLMPPRLLDSCGPYGACQRPPAGWVDTMRTVGGLWSFDNEAVDAVSNQYAAMPSMHIGWSSWVTLVGWHLATPLSLGWRRVARTAAVVHPFATLFGIVVTANHYWLDAVGGWVALSAGLGCAWLYGRAVPRSVPSGSKSAL